MSDIVRNEHGAEVCQRVKQIAVENVPKQPAKGFHYVKAYCNRPLSLSISENKKFCPDCDKPAPVGNVNPRITNSAGTTLTPAELKECGLTEDTTLVPKVATKVKVSRKPREAKTAVEAKVKVQKDVVTIQITLDLLEQAEDIARTLITGAIKSMDQLPVTNFAESKRLIRLQEKLEALLKV